MIQKKEEHDGSKYATASDEAEFHEALNRGLAVELTWELAERIGLMVEDVGSVEEIDAARSWRWFRCRFTRRTGSASWCREGRGSSARPGPYPIRTNRVWP